MQSNKVNTPTTYIPVATQWTLDAVDQLTKITIPNVFIIKSTDTGSKGSGFLLSNGYIVTNRHVVTGSLDKLIAISSSGNNVQFSNSHYDTQTDLDLILLKPTIKLEGGLDLDLEENLNIGTPLYTWGYPLAHNGPAPLFSSGYLSGFREYRNNGQLFKHFIVNGAFNSGNSGGALFKHGSNKVIGIVTQCAGS